MLQSLICLFADHRCRNLYLRQGLNHSTRKTDLTKDVKIKPRLKTGRCKGIFACLFCCKKVTCCCCNEETRHLSAAKRLGKRKYAQSLSALLVSRFQSSLGHWLPSLGWCSCCKREGTKASIFYVVVTVLAQDHPWLNWIAVELGWIELYCNQTVIELSYWMTLNWVD